MTTYVTLNGSQTYTRNYDQPHDRPAVIVTKSTHNFTANSAAADAVVNFLAIPAESVILGVSVNVDSKQDNTDVKVGITADDDAFATALDTATNGASIRPTTIGKVQGQPLYTNAATNVIVTAVSNEINACTLTVVATYIKLGDVGTT
jgi:hypothetical protein